MKQIKYLLACIIFDKRKRFLFCENPYAANMLFKLRFCLANLESHHFEPRRLDSDGIEEVILPRRIYAQQFLLSNSV